MDAIGGWLDSQPFITIIPISVTINFLSSAIPSSVSQAEAPMNELRWVILWGVVWEGASPKETPNSLMDEYFIFPVSLLFRGEHA